MKNSEFPKLKKTLAFILTFAMLLSAVITAAAVPATAATDVWDGTIADSYAGGKGTLDEPYLISNGSELAKMVNEGDGSYEKYFKLTNDIYLNDVSDSNWKNNNPKAWYTRPAISNKAFQGTLDGDGHTVNGIYYNGSDSLVGLLPAIKNTVTVKNIQIDNSYIESTGYGIAALIGFVQGGSTVTVSKTYIHENVTLMCKNTSTEESAGGLFAYGWGTITVLDCAVLSSQSSGTLAGSIMGNIWWGSINVSNSFLGDKMFGKCPSVTLNIANCYTAVEDSTGKTSICSLENMKGEAAKANMPNLDWENVWDTTDSFPVFKNINLDGVKGEIWDGEVATGYSGGSGTETDPYIIETARQLAYLIKHDVVDSAGATNGKYYKLAADIYLNDVSNPDWKSNNPNSWYEVDSSKRFAGNLDGDGYTVYGLYYSGTASFGLIPWVDMWSYDVTIKNLVISDAYISTSGQFVGSVVGFVYANSSTRGATLTISDCFADDNVYIFSSNASAYIGGLVGCLQSNSLNTYNFIGSASLADVRHGGGDWKCYAGLVGPAGDGNYNIDNCFAFPTLAIYSGGASVPANNSYSIPSQGALLTVIGDNAKTTMPDFDWKDGAFAPTQNSYPRLKIVSQRMGDINGDDKSNSEDLILLRKHLLGIETALVWDINSDGEQNILDLVNLKKKTVAYVIPENGYVPEGYSLVWNDEFKGRTIDNAKWRTNQPRMTAYDGVGNFNEGTVRSVGNGRLLMTAYKNPDTANYNGKTYLTTNSITTENRMSFKYGYLEVRAKVPYKAGCWPSLWLRSPNAKQTDLTGKDGYNMEVDIIEPFGYTDKNGITIHETNKSDEKDHCQAAVGNYKFKNAENLANEYHTYGFLWTADEMKFYIDGECFATHTMAALKEKGYKGDFDDTVNILFDNQLITTNSPVANEEKTNTIENNEGSLPAEYSVEYVRLYQKQGDVLVLETPADGQ